MQRGIALIHAKEDTREECRFVAAGAGAHFEDGAAIVGGVARNEEHAKLGLQPLDPIFELTLFVLGERAHLTIRCRIGDQRVGFGKLALRVAERARLLRHRIELGELARKPNVVLSRLPRRQHRRNRLVAVDERAQALLWDRGGHEAAADDESSSLSSCHGLTMASIPCVSGNRDVTEWIPGQARNDDNFQEQAAASRQARCASRPRRGARRGFPMRTRPDRSARSAAR